YRSTVRDPALSALRRGLAMRSGSWHDSCMSLGCLRMDPNSPEPRQQSALPERQPRPLDQTPRGNIMRLSTKTLLAAAVLAAAGIAPAFAADTTTFNVTITIQDTCDVDAAAATNVEFGGVAST